MKFLVASHALLLVLLLLIGQLPRGTLQMPRTRGLLIESAPSVVAYQGSAQSHTQFVISPMGRALGHLEPAVPVNRTVSASTALETSTVGATAASPNDSGLDHLDVLSISPVYTPY